MYFDSGIVPDFRDISAKRELFQNLGFFGIRSCFAICNFETLPLLDELKKEFPHLSIYSRCVIHAEDTDFLKKQYQRFSGKFDIISVQSRNTDVLNFAARDSRFHILSLTTQSEWMAFTAGTASLAYQHSTGVEFPVDFLTKPSGVNSYTIRQCRKAINIARVAHAPILLSSFASSKFDLIGGREIGFIAWSIFGVPLRIGKQITSENPLLVLKKRNRGLEQGEIAEGVRIISNQDKEDGRE